MVTATGLLEISLGIGARAPASSRRALDALLAQLEPGVLEKVRLLVNELVSNSVRHSGLGADGSVGVRVEVGIDSVRVEVRDAGPGFKVADAPPSLEEGSGWGLFLVDRLSDSWGVDCQDGACVWFEVDRFA